GLRMLRKNAGFTLVAVASIALGIGANSTVFSIVDSLLLRPWPVKDPERLVAIETSWPKEPDFHRSSYPDYRDIAREITAFSDVVAFGMRGGFVSGEGQGREVNVEVVSQNYFHALGVEALRGRMFASQPGRAATESRSVVVSYSLWRNYYRGDPSLPGKVTLLDGKPFTVIGIAARGFCGLRRGWSPDIWVTTDGWNTMVPGEASTYDQRDIRWFEVTGRLHSGTSINEVRAQLQALAKRTSLAFPATNRDVRFVTRPASALTQEDKGLGIYLMAMVSLVLLISCANVASLLLAQTERRRREIAMRRALGAAQGRLVRQFLTEGLLLSLAGALLGVFLASLLMRIVPAMVPVLSFTDLQVDGRVLLFTAGISLLMVVAFGLAPALRAAGWDLIAALKGDDFLSIPTPRSLPLRSLLVSGEIALSVVLLAGSALLLRSLLYSRQIHPGFDPNKKVLMLSVAPPTLYGYSRSQAAALYPAMAARAESVPGVVRASYARRPPLTGSESGETKAVSIPGVLPPPGTDHFRIRYNIVAPKFFAAIGGRLERGREFERFDLPSTAPVVLINDAMARRFWLGQDPLDRTIQMDKKDYRIVGVVRTGKYVSLHEASQPYLFLPFTQVLSFECTLFVETAGEPQAIVPMVLKEMAAVDSHLPVVSAITFQDYMRDVLSGERSMVTLLAGALAVSRLLSQFVHGIPLRDPLSYGSSALIAILVALLASYIPARRAMRVDPTIALRYE
ncbi:MAG TPA: ABC transporter permease, partial [Bryobacteraceae bacterium]|nr:ABC transporter permease [Bryobacteraceae bacterium]